MRLAQLTHHSRDIIEVVDRACEVASVIADHHEVGGVAGEASSGQVVPTAQAGDVAARARLGGIGIVESFIAYAFSSC